MNQLEPNGKSSPDNALISLRADATNFLVLSSVDRGWKLGIFWVFLFADLVREIAGQKTKSI